MGEIAFSWSLAILAVIFVVMAIAGLIKQVSDDNAGVVSYYMMWSGIAGCIMLSAIFAVGAFSTLI